MYAWVNIKCWQCRINEDGMWNIVNEKSKIFRVDNVVFTSSDEVFPKIKKKKRNRRR